MLTQKQESFCISYIEIGNASQAYRQSYNSANMADATINRKAKELLDNGKIAARIESIRSKAAEAVGLTLQQHLTDLKRLRDMAESSEKYGPAVQAEVARGKASGLYVEKIEHSGEIKTPELKLVLHGTAPTAKAN